MLQREQYSCTDVPQHVRQTIRRILGIQWHISAASFENAKYADYHLQASLHANRNRDVSANPQRSQAMSDLIGARVELGVNEMVAFENERDAVRRALDLFFEQLVNAFVVDRSGVDGVEVDQLLQFHFADDLVVVEPAIRIKGYTLEECLKFRLEPIYIFSAKQVGVVMKLSGERVLGPNAAKLERKSV
jgi:hypothetical protein